MKLLDSDEYVARAVRWRERYEQGATIAALAAAAGVSEITVARSMRSVGAVMRPRGSKPRLPVGARRGLSATAARGNGKRRHGADK